ncbi:serine hydrolase domain-containing protein [Nocardia sp. NPDC052278]|uniref:serine hydrolase domain-containing protein n=1 Tax=unclassified Nocardia TaxID=2637762 RepID=UPI0036C52916
MSGSHHHVLSRRIRAVLALPVVAVLLTTGCGTTDSDRAQAFPADLAGQIDQIMKSHIDAGLIPGAAVSIIDPEHGTYSQAYGVADTATGRRAEVRDHYRVGSITKTFVATAVLRLADAQKLSLDDPLRKYIDAIPNGDIITVRDLLGMRGGVYDFAASPEFQPQLLTATPDRVWSIGDDLRIIRDNPDKAAPPNSRSVYSNSEYLLLGLILEKVTGRPVRDVVNDLAGDYGLHDTGYPSDADLPTPGSRGYAYDKDVRTDVTARTPPTLWEAAGSLVASVPDLATYAAALGEGRFLEPRTYTARTTFTDNYGLGLMSDGSWIGHSGAVLGYTSMTMYLPERNVSVAVAVNQYTPAYRSLLIIDATDIWTDMVARLYPGTISGLDNLPTAQPPIPAPADLTAELAQALNPSIPASAKNLRIEGDDKDPDLVTKLARAYTHSALEVTVDKTTDIGRNRLIATTSTTTSNGNVPMLIPLVPIDNAWRLDDGWVCMQIVADGQRSPACP